MYCWCMGCTDGVTISIYIICMLINDLLGDMVAVWGYDIVKVGYYSTKYTHLSVDMAIGYLLILFQARF